MRKKLLLSAMIALLSLAVAVPVYASDPDELASPYKIDVYTSASTEPMVCRSAVSTYGTATIVTSEEENAVVTIQLAPWSVAQADQWYASGYWWQPYCENPVLTADFLYSPSGAVTGYGEHAYDDHDEDTNLPTWVQYGMDTLYSYLDNLTGGLLPPNPFQLDTNTPTIDIDDPAPDTWVFTFTDTSEVREAYWGWTISPTIVEGSHLVDVDVEEDWWVDWNYTNTVDSGQLTTGTVADFYIDVM